MATLLPSIITAPGEQPAIFNVVASGDEFEVVAGRTNLLVLTNNTGEEVSGSFIGSDTPATHTCQGYGYVTTEAQSFVVADGAAVVFNLNYIAALTAGVVTITGGDGLEAAIFVS